MNAPIIADLLFEDEVVKLAEGSKMFVHINSLLLLISSNKISLSVDC